MWKLIQKTAPTDSEYAAFDAAEIVGLGLNELYALGFVLKDESMNCDTQIQNIYRYSDGFGFIRRRD